MRFSQPMRVAVEHPGKLRVGSDLRLVEDDRGLGIDAGGEIARRHLPRALAQHLRVLPQGDGVLVDDAVDALVVARSEEHTSELQSLMRTSYAVYCLTQQISTYTHRHQAIHSTSTN